ncbi:hypothetical protein BDV95DRAFT_263139 [Massariosphaeria phaeospora]|uniref:Uncharacterized protein n=1 Tax=Massariosphaeria phaeospora TaxID=100035 RepID=A0A7C8I2G8_9PLEO|nr:hypothetical protein BDV95DRAFT_263139 [Massariosphaeria phaeospora]
MLDVTPVFSVFSRGSGAPPVAALLGFIGMVRIGRLVEPVLVLEGSVEPVLLWVSGRVSAVLEEPVWVLKAVEPVLLCCPGRSSARPVEPVLVPKGSVELDLLWVSGKISARPVEPVLEPLLEPKGLVLSAGVLLLLPDRMPVRPVESVGSVLEPVLELKVLVLSVLLLKGLVVSALLLELGRISLRPVEPVLELKGLLSVLLLVSTVLLLKGLVVSALLLELGRISLVMVGPVLVLNPGVVSESWVDVSRSLPVAGLDTEVGFSLYAR